MRIVNLKGTGPISFKHGWFIGDFEPSLLRTKDFEVGIMEHIKDEVWERHVHYKADEYNYLVKGKMKIEVDGVMFEIEEGEVFVIHKGEVCKPYFLTDCTVVVIKVPSVPGDKHVKD